MKNVNERNFSSSSLQLEKNQLHQLRLSLTICQLSSSFRNENVTVSKKYRQKHDCKSLQKSFAVKFDKKTWTWKNFDMIIKTKNYWYTILLWLKDYYKNMSIKTLLNSSLSYKLYFTYNENLITKKRRWAVKSRRFSYKSNAIMKLYAILSRKFWEKSNHKLYNSINKKTT